MWPSVVSRTAVVPPSKKRQPPWVGQRILVAAVGEDPHPPGHADRRAVQIVGLAADGQRDLAPTPAATQAITASGS